MFTLCALSKAGYGTITELKQLDTDDIMDMIEFESISADIQHYEQQKR